MPSFQWYKIMVDAAGKKTRVIRQMHVRGDMPRLGNSHEDIRNNYGDRAHREWYVTESRWYKKQVPAKVAK